MTEGTEEMTQSPMTMDAGRALDALIAEKVMGETLTVPREHALAIVGAAYVRVTGKVFTLSVRGQEFHIPMPPGDALPGHPSDFTVNSRYFRHAAEQVLAKGGEIATAVEADVAACRLSAKPYSTDIAAAWLVVEKFRVTTEDDETFVSLTDCGAQGWLCTIEENLNPSDAAARIGEGMADTPALAICRAALAAMEVQS